MRFLKILVFLLGGSLGVVYLLNPGAGVIEFIPDALPIIGNLDEAAAVGLVVTCFQGLQAMRQARALPAPNEATQARQSAPQVASVMNVASVS